MTTGVLYVVWPGRDDIEAYLDRSIESVRRHHPQWEIHVERLEYADEGPRALLRKPSAIAKSPFDETLFLDADTVVLGNLEFGFTKARQFGLACCICENPWARRYINAGFDTDAIEYNTGVLFMTKAAQPLLQSWTHHALALDSRLAFVKKGEAAFMPHNDQAGFARAIEDTGFNPFILPINWNFRPTFHSSFFGPIRIWHGYQDVPPDFHALNAHYDAADAIIDYHQRSG